LRLANSWQTLKNTVVLHYDFWISGLKVFYGTGIGLMVLAIGLVVLKFITPGPKRTFMLFWTGFACIWTIFVTVMSTYQYGQAVWVTLHEECELVEGIVEQFDPMPAVGHKHESFLVKGQSFEYSDFQATVGFNNAKSLGGPIDEGKYVRIRHYHGTILTLWLKE